MRSHWPEPPLALARGPLQVAMPSLIIIQEPTHTRACGGHLGWTYLTLDQCKGHHTHLVKTTRRVPIQNIPR